MEAASGQVLMSRGRWSVLRDAIVCLVITGVASGLTYEYAKQVSARKLSDRANNSLSLVAGTIEATIGRYKYLPDVIALAPEIQELFAENSTSKPNTADSKQVANRYLERVNSQAGSAALFVVDREGTGIASSNWGIPRESFVDQSYRERPYRIQAMNRGEGRFYGQGKTTLIPGYFLATAIRKDERIVGIAVVKIDLASLEKGWKEAGEPVAVADKNGVLFLSSEPVWRYRPLRNIDTTSLDAIHAAKQYPDLKNEPLLGRELPYAYGAQVRLKVAGNTAKTRILFTRDLPARGWTLTYFGDPAEVHRSAALAATAVGLAVVAAFMGAFVIRERQRTLQVERKAKCELEARVEERTIELRDANARLTDEVEVRRKTEAELFRTRDRLIEAARRAALGQFLAGLVHETNQPLAALRTYLSSTRLLAAKGKTEEAIANLATMQTVLDHLSQLSGRLKMMIRGDKKEFQATNLSECAGRVLSLLRPHFQQLDIALSVEVAPDMRVHGDGVRLDQILLNLLNNAVDALHGRKDGCVRIRLFPDKNSVTLVVEDNGTGVPQNKANRLFEPFFTTKEPGLGLGLGLATVHRIVADHDGIIEYRRSELGGAAFQVVFPAIAARVPALSEASA